MKIYIICYENNVSLINDMEIWLSVHIEDMLPPQYKKGLRNCRFRGMMTQDQG